MKGLTAKRVQPVDLFWIGPLSTVFVYEGIDIVISEL